RAHQYVRANSLGAQHRDQDSRSPYVIASHSANPSAACLVGVRRRPDLREQARGRNGLEQIPAAAREHPRQNRVSGMYMRPNVDAPDRIPSLSGVSTPPSMMIPAFEQNKSI